MHGGTAHLNKISFFTYPVKFSRPGLPVGAPTSRGLAPRTIRFVRKITGRATVLAMGNLKNRLTATGATNTVPRLFRTLRKLATKSSAAYPATTAAHRAKATKLPTLRPQTRRKRPTEPGYPMAPSHHRQRRRTQRSVNDKGRVGLPCTPSPAHQELALPLHGPVSRSPHWGNRGEGRLTLSRS